MKIVIIEDELYAANLLSRLIQELDPTIQIQAKLTSISESLTFFTNNPHPTLIFADIELGDGLSFEIFNKIKPDCPVIFTTAYDQYAIEAFKSNGIGYLLKPISKNELKIALDKYEQFFKPADAFNIGTLTDLMNQGDRFKNRFTVRIGNKIKIIKVSEIMALFSLQKGSFLFTKDLRNYPVEGSLDQIMQVLNPQQFFRINRRYIVALAYINDISAWSANRLKINISGMEQEQLIVARERTRQFKEWLDQ